MIVTSEPANLADSTVLSVTTHSYPPQRYGGSESSTHDMCALPLERCIRPVVLAREEHGSDTVDTAFGYDVVRARDPLASIARVVESHAPAAAIVQSGRQLECAQRLVALGVPTLVYVRDVEFEEVNGAFFAAPLLGYIAGSAFTAGEVRRPFGLSNEAAYATYVAAARASSKRPEIDEQLLIEKLLAKLRSVSGRQPSDSSATV